MSVHKKMAVIVNEIEFEKIVFSLLIFMNFPTPSYYKQPRLQIWILTMVWCVTRLQLMMWFSTILERNLPRRYVRADFRTLHLNPTAGMQWEVFDSCEFIPSKSRNLSTFFLNRLVFRLQTWPLHSSWRDGWGPGLADF